MLGLCATCKWWGDDADATDLGPLYSGRHGCALTLIRSFGSPGDPTSKALPVTALGDKAIMMTTPDFGCVQWKQKES